MTFFFFWGGGGGGWARPWYPSPFKAPTTPVLTKERMELRGSQSQLTSPAWTATRALGAAFEAGGTESCVVYVKGLVGVS